MLDVGSIGVLDSPTTLLVHPDHPSFLSLSSRQSRLLSSSAAGPKLEPASAAVLEPTSPRPAPAAVAVVPQAFFSTASQRHRALATEQTTAMLLQFISRIGAVFESARAVSGVGGDPHAVLRPGSRAARMLKDAVLRNMETFATESVMRRVARACLGGCWNSSNVGDPGPLVDHRVLRLSEDGIFRTSRPWKEAAERWSRKSSSDLADLVLRIDLNSVRGKHKYVFPNSLKQVEALQIGFYPRASGQDGVTTSGGSLTLIVLSLLGGNRSISQEGDDEHATTAPKQPPKHVFLETYRNQHASPKMVSIVRRNNRPGEENQQQAHWDENNRNPLVKSPLEQTQRKLRLVSGSTLQSGFCGHLEDAMRLTIQALRPSSFPLSFDRGGGLEQYLQGHTSPYWEDRSVLSYLVDKPVGESVASVVERLLAREVGAATLDELDRWFEARGGVESSLQEKSVAALVGVNSLDEKPWQTFLEFVEEQVNRFREKTVGPFRGRKFDSASQYGRDVHDVGAIALPRRLFVGVCTAYGDLYELSMVMKKPHTSAEQSSETYIPSPDSRIIRENNAWFFVLTPSTGAKQTTDEASFPLSVFTLDDRGRRIQKKLAVARILESSSDSLVPHDVVRHAEGGGHNKASTPKRAASASCENDLHSEQTLSLAQLDQDIARNQLPLLQFFPQTIPQMLAASLAMAALDPALPRKLIQSMREKTLNELAKVAVELELRIRNRFLHLFRNGPGGSRQNFGENLEFRFAEGVSLDGELRTELMLEEL